MSMKAYGGDPLGLWGETDPDERSGGCGFADRESGWS